MNISELLGRSSWILWYLNNSHILHYVRNPFNSGNDKKLTGKHGRLRTVSTIRSKSFSTATHIQSMLLGIISDTHDRLKVTKKAVALFKEAGITTLLHAGDFISPFVVPLLGDFQVYGTFGNNDGEKKGLLTKFDDIGACIKEYFCEVHLDGLEIAVTHGHIPALLEVLLKSQLHDLVVTGHTHNPELKEGKTVVINPGECCGYLSNRSTVAVFDTRKKKGEIIEIP